jgi:hypothetical protein
MRLDPRFATCRFVAVAINALGIEPTVWDAMRDRPPDPPSILKWSALPVPSAA